MSTAATRKAIRRDRSRLKMFITEWAEGKLTRFSRHRLRKRKDAIARLQARLSDLDDPGVIEKWLKWKPGDPVPVCVEELKREPLPRQESQPPFPEPVAVEDKQQQEELRRKRELGNRYLQKLKRSIYRYEFPDYKKKRRFSENTLLQNIRKYQAICIQLQSDRSVGLVWVNWEPGGFVPLPAKRNKAK